MAAEDTTAFDDYHRSVLPKLAASIISLPLATFCFRLFQPGERFAQQAVLGACPSSDIIILSRSKHGAALHTTLHSCRQYLDYARALHVLCLRTCLTRVTRFSIPVSSFVPDLQTGCLHHLQNGAPHGWRSRRRRLRQGIRERAQPLWRPAAAAWRWHGTRRATWWARLCR